MVNKLICYSTWALWLALVIAWNYMYPDVEWWEDVFATVCLAAFNRSLTHRFMVNKPMKGK